MKVNSKKVTGKIVRYKSKRNRFDLVPSKLKRKFYDSIYKGSPDETIHSGLLSIFSVIGIYFFVLPMFFLCAYITYGVVLVGLDILFPRASETFYRDFALVFVGLFLGLIGSMIVQSIQKQNQSLADIVKSLFHHFGHFIAILTAILIWVLIILILN